MMNKTGMVGVGRIQNGVMMFTDATGKGFAKSISRPAAPAIEETIKEEVVVTVKEEVLTVPSFIQEYSKRKQELASKVIYVNFNKGEEVEEEKEMEDIGEKVVEVIDGAVDAVKKVIKRNPVFKYFFGEEE